MSILRTAVQYGATNHNLINVEIDTAYDFGDGNHTIEVSGDKTDIKTGNGNSNIKSYGNEANVTTGNGNNKIVSYGSDASITTGSGNQKITSIGDNKTIVTDGGDDDITFIGDGCTLEAGDGNNKVIFWGNNTDIKTGNGDDDIKTFDQVYDEEDYSDLAQAFIATLPTGVWEDWNRIARHQIDYICKKSLMSKSQTWVYEDTYDVYTIFSRYINGLKNVNIDMGGGENTASLTVDKASSNIVDNGKKVNLSNSNIKFNEDDSLDTVLDKRNETKLDVKTKSNTRWGGVFVAAAIATIATIATWGAAAPLMTGALAACGASAATATTVGTVIGCGLGAMGAIAGSISLSEIGYKAATGQTLHTGDWVNAGASALAFAGGWAAVAGNAMRGTYAASQGDYVGAAVSFAAAGLGATGADCLGYGTVEGTDQLSTIGKFAHGVNLAANGVNIVDKGIKIAEGDAKFGDWASLGSSIVSSCYSGSSLASGKDTCLAIKTEKPKKDEKTETTGGKNETADKSVTEKPTNVSGKKPAVTNNNNQKSQDGADLNGKDHIVGTPDKNGGATAGNSAAKDQHWTDYVGDCVSDVVEIPGILIGKSISGLGSFIGKDNMVGEFLVSGGDKITGISKWMGNIVGNPWDTVSSLLTSTNNVKTESNDASTPAQSQESKWDRFVTKAKEVGSDMVDEAIEIGGNIVDGACDAYYAVTGATHPITYYANINGTLNHTFKNDEEYDDEPLIRW